MSNLNNLDRSLAAGVAGALSFAAASTGDSGVSYTATLAPAIDAYTNHFLYCVTFGTANSSTASTLNLNSIGAKTVKNIAGNAIPIGALNGDHFLIYDGTNLRVINPTCGGATLTAQADNPTATTSLTDVMMGLAFQITPILTGRLAVSIAGAVSNSTAMDGADVLLKYGSGTPPSNGDAATGTNVTHAQPGVVNNANSAAITVPFSITGIVTGLSLGTTYWFDAAIKAVTGGQANISNIGLVAYEF